MRSFLRHRVPIAFLAILATSCTERAPTGDGGQTPNPFDAGVAGLPEAKPSRVIEAKDGDTVRMAVQWVAKWIAGRKVRMLGYDGSIPGPTLKVPEGAAITLLLRNETGLPTSLHSHGVRLDQSQDGMPGLTQPPIDSGATHAYALRFPDPGIYWYHPHVREDYGLELGLYGNYWVVPGDPAYWPPVHREVLLMLDDILLEGDALKPFYRNRVDHTLMGRFGNAFLVNGDTAFTLKVKEGEVIRFYATNASSARVFNLEMSPLKSLDVIGADNGRYEYSTIRERDIIAPSERLIFQVLFKKDMGDGDTVRLFHKYERQGRFQETLLATFVYDGDTAFPNLESSMETVVSPRIAASIDSVRGAFDRPPDRVLEMTGTMDMARLGLMKKAHDPDNTDYMGIEWYDEMGLMSTGSHDGNTSWILRDDETGKENHAIDWAFKKGEPVMIRIHNDPYAVHSMPHPIHFHGQRFLVVREQGKLQKENLVWRDSYLIGRGFTVDILLDASNPGEWMMHCHIPEHLGARMMGHFRVVDSPPARPAPHPWSLSLTPDAGGPAWVLRGDSALTARAAGEIAGQVVGFDPAVLAPEITVLKSAYVRKPFTVPLDAQGGFRFSFNGKLGPEVGPMTLHFSPRSLDPAKRPFPHKIRVALNRAGKRPWSLDLDLAGDASFAGLSSDTTAEGAFLGEFGGKVNGFDPAVFEDTVFFVNVQYPKESTVKAPLGPDRTFAFDSADLLGGTDGSIFVDILLKPRNGFAADPEKIRLICNRNL
jgi:suppressor of ftsI